MRFLCLMFLLNPGLYGLDMAFAVFGDCVCYVFGVCVDVGEIVCVEVCKFDVFVVHERAPICSVVVSVGALGLRCKWTV